METSPAGRKVEKKAHARETKRSILLSAVRAIKAWFSRNADGVGGRKKKDCWCLHPNDVLKKGDLCLRRAGVVRAL